MTTSDEPQQCKSSRAQVAEPTRRWMRRWIGWLAIATVCGWIGCRRAEEPQAPAASPPITPTVVATHNRGVACMGQFDYAQACEIFTGLAQSYPEWWDVQVDLAIASLNRRQAGDSEQAATLLQTVQQHDPQNLRAHYCQGIVALDQGDPQTALQKFRHVAQADPQDAYAVYYAGQCLAQLSQMAPALEHYERAMAIDPYLRSAYYAAFQACLRLGQKEKANRYRDEFLRLENNPQARLAEMKYTRMGSKAEVSFARAESTALDRPAGDVFAPAVVLPVRESGNMVWSNSTDTPAEHHGLRLQPGRSAGSVAGRGRAGRRRPQPGTRGHSGRFSLPVAAPAGVGVAGHRGRLGRLR